MILFLTDRNTSIGLGSPADGTVHAARFQASASQTTKQTRRDSLFVSISLSLIFEYLFNNISMMAFLLTQSFFLSMTIL